MAHADHHRWTWSFFFFFLCELCVWARSFFWKRTKIQEKWWNASIAQHLDKKIGIPSSLKLVADLSVYPFRVQTTRTIGQMQATVILYYNATQQTVAMPNTKQTTLKRTIDITSAFWYFHRDPDNPYVSAFLLLLLLLSSLLLFLPIFPCAILPICIYGFYSLCSAYVIPSNVNIELLLFTQKSIATHVG